MQAMGAKHIHTVSPDINVTFGRGSDIPFPINEHTLGSSCGNANAASFLPERSNARKSLRGMVRRKSLDVAEPVAKRHPVNLLKLTFDMVNQAFK